MQSVTKFLQFSSLMLPLFLLIGCTPQVASPRMANELEIIEQRVIVLEQQKLKTLANLREEVAEFKRKSNKEIENFRKSQAFFIEELNKLNEDMQISTNDIERSQRDIRKNKNVIQALNRRLGNQVIALQELQKFFKSGIDIPSDTPKKDEMDFETAHKLYKSRSFQKAEDAFIKYRKSHPNSDLVDDSLYFIAYMYSLQGDYSKASLRFFELLKQYPNSNRKDDAKWWLGVSLERSGDLNGALDIYKELTLLPPNSPLRIKAQFRLEELAPTE